MRIITESAIRRFWLTHPDAEPSLAKWLHDARAANWGSLQEVRQRYPSADGVAVASGNIVTVFDASGNKYRLVVSIKFRWHVIYVRDFLTHAEYSKDRWKHRH